MNLIDLRYIDNLKDLDLDTVDTSKPAPEFEPNRQFYFMAKARSWVKKKSEELGRPMTFFTQTFGCQMNARDSEKLCGILEKIGYVEYLRCKYRSRLPTEARRRCAGNYGK